MSREINSTFAADLEAIVTEYDPTLDDLVAVAQQPPASTEKLDKTSPEKEVLKGEEPVVLFEPGVTLSSEATKTDATLPSHERDDFAIVSDRISRRVFLGVVGYQAASTALSRHESIEIRTRTLYRAGIAYIKDAVNFFVTRKDVRQ